MRKTKEVVAEMMKENTGRHMLDSGGAYGRNWEKNQDKNFEDEPVFNLDVWNDSVEVTYNLYHFLTSFVEYSPEWQERFEEWMQSNDRERTPYMADMEEFAESLGYEAHTVNSYNGQTILSQVIQYTVIYETGADWVWDYEVVLLQVHGGCDVRGGYTAPKAFIIEDFASFITAQSDIIAYIPDLELHASSDDCGYSWYGDFEIDEEGCEFDEENNEVYFLAEDGNRYKIDFAVRQYH